MNEVCIVQASDSFLKLFLRYAGQLPSLVGAGRELTASVDTVFKPKISSKPHILEAGGSDSFYPAQRNPSIARGGGQGGV